MDAKIPEAEYRRILAMIADEQSPVGIDAKHTHVIIIDKLIRLEKRLDELERRLEERSARPGPR